MNQKTAIQFADSVLQRLPFPVEVIQTDNGAEFGSVFHWHLLDEASATPTSNQPHRDLNGKVERSHRIDAEEFYRLLDGELIDDAQVFNDKLREWEDYYNYHRPHGSLDGQTPYERLSLETRPGCNQRPSVAQHPFTRLVGLSCTRSRSPDACEHAEGLVREHFSQDRARQWLNASALWYESGVRGRYSNATLYATPIAASTP